MHRRYCFWHSIVRRACVAVRCHEGRGRERRLPRRLSVGSDGTGTDDGAPKHRHGFVKS